MELKFEKKERKSKKNFKKSAKPIKTLEIYCFKNPLVLQKNRLFNGRFEAIAKVDQIDFVRTNILQ